MRNRPGAVMIFAAGLGRRMAPLTERMPKPLVEVGGRALIDHALEVARAAGFERIVVNTHHLAPMLEAHLAGAGVTLVHEPELLETGGGLRNALHLLGEGPVVTLNSDAVWGGASPLGTLLEAWDGERMEGLVLLAEPGRAHGHQGGDFSLDGEGRIGRGGPLIYTGAQVIWPGRVAAVPEAKFSMNLAWDGMIGDGRLYGTVWPGEWCDVGRPEGIAEAERMLRKFGHVRGE